MSTPIVTRFAPSPTGYLHVGGARTALFSWLLARHQTREGEAPSEPSSAGEAASAAGIGHSRFLLRIEDTDLARSTQQACDQLLEDLKWLGLHWDNADNLVFQSKRVDLYNRLIADLITRGLAYEAWETTEELTALRQQAERAKRPFVYRRL